MKFSVLNLGCKSNQAESTLIESGLMASGHSIVGLEDAPDFCIVNTCTVTSKSDYQSRQLIRRAHRAGASVIVTGCYSELNRESVKEMDGVVRVFGNKEKDLIVKEIIGRPGDAAFSQQKVNKSRLFLKVQDGCDYSCSYCIIPKARGRSRSLKIQEIIEKVGLAEPDFKEVVLTGIHLGTYGYDLVPKVNLSKLLRELLVKTNIHRLRISSLEVNEIDEELIEIIRDERVCKHLHIPIQSGSDRILYMMNRNYTARDLSSGIRLIGRQIPGISIGTDVITGFPGEGDREFNETMCLLEELPFSYLHVFPFSPREGTKAASLEGAVPADIKKERVSLLISLGREKRQAYMEGQIGKTLDLLIEKEESESTFLGTTGNYLKARVPLSNGSLRSVVNIRVEAVENDILLGSRLSDF